MHSVEVLDADLRHVTDEAHGLAPAIFWVLTFLDATDGSARSMPRRAYHPESTRSIYLPEGARGADLHLSPDAKAAYAGPVRCRRTADRLTVSAPDESSRLDATATSLAWFESDLVEMSGTAVGPACRLHLTDPAFPLLYTTRPYRVGGTVRDAPVEGAALLVSVHLPENADLLTSPLLSRLQIAWVEYINEHADGTFESGLLVRGREGLTAMAVHRCDGTTLATAQVEADIDNDGGDPEFPRRIAFTGGGETVTWQSLPSGGRWPARSDIPDGYRFRQGVVRRDGVAPPAISYAFAETFQERM